MQLNYGDEKKIAKINKAKNVGHGEKKVIAINNQGKCYIDVVQKL